MRIRTIIKAWRVLAILPLCLCLSASAAAAKDIYPTVEELVNAVSEELGWPAGATIEEKLFALRAEKVIPYHLTPRHPATPTTVIAMMEKLLRRSRANKEDADLALSALIRAAAAIGAPIPSFPPEREFRSEKIETEPVVRPTMDISRSHPLYVPHPFSTRTIVIIHKGHGGHHPHGRKTLRHLRDIPHTIFRIGESPAEKGPGVFPRH